MANDKTYDRHVNIWINGKEVQNDIKSIEKEMFALYREYKKAEVGSKEYNDAAKGLRQVKSILADHRADINATGSAWTKVKGFFNSAKGVIAAGAGAIYAAYQSIKGVVTSTGDLSDRLDVTLAGWKSGVDAIKRSMADVNFKDFLKNIKDAIEEGRRYAEGLDEVDDKTRALRVEEALAANQLLEQRKIQSDVRKTLKERNDAGKEAIRIEERIATIRTSLTKQAFENELDNITSIAFGTENVNEKTREQILLYLRRDEAFMKSIEPAQKWKDLQEKINTLKSQEYTMMSSGQGSYSVQNKNITDQIELLKEQQKQYESEHDLLSRLMIPTDEKYNLLTEKWVALEGAKGSAMENTMKIFTKNAGIEKQLASDQEEIIASSLANLQTIIDSAKYNPEEFYSNADLDAWVESQAKANDEVEKDTQDSRDTIYRIVMEQADKTLIELKKKNDEEKEVLRKKTQIYLDFAHSLGSILGTTAFNAEKTAGEVVKDIIKLSLNALQDLVWIAIGETTIINLAKSGWKGLIEAAAITVLIEGAFETAKSAVNSMYWMGGPTGPGGKYEPAGIVHKGEWVANQEMVSSPVTGPVIQMLEGIRVSGMKNLASGGYPAGTGSGAITFTDPAILRTLDNIDQFLKMLLYEGVKNKYTWEDIDSLNRAIGRLNDFEDKVSI